MMNAISRMSPPHPGHASGNSSPTRAGREEQKNKFAYLPFGAGPRICLGASFAMIESQIIVGTLLARFRVRLADREPVTPTQQMTLRTSRPVLLRLERAPLS